MVLVFGNFINGEWVNGSSGKTFTSINPANTDEEVARYQFSSIDDVRQALEAASKAQPGWSAIPAPNRGIVLMKAAEILEKHGQ